MGCAARLAIDLIRNYGPGTRDGASGFDRAAGTVASCSFVVEEFDRLRRDASMADQQEDEPRPRASPDSERLLTTSGDDLTASWTMGELRQ